MIRRILLCFFGLFLMMGIKLNAYDFQSCGIYYDILDENNVAVTGVFTYKNEHTYIQTNIYEGEIVIPPNVTYNGRNYSVTSIGPSAFQYQKNISITIPSSITSIGDRAFSNCNGLKDITSEIKTPFKISENVFSVYSTAKLIVPKGTKSVYQSTNYWNKFANIVENQSNLEFQLAEDMEVTLTLGDLYMNCGDALAVSESDMKSLVFDKLGQNGLSKQEFENAFQLDMETGQWARRYYKTNNSYKLAIGERESVARNYISSYTADNNWFGRVWYTSNNLVWNMTDNIQEGGMSYASYLKLREVSRAEPASRGMNVRTISTVVRFINKGTGKSIWVTLNFNSGKIHFEYGSIENKDWTKWSDNVNTNAFSLSSSEEKNIVLTKYWSRPSEMVRMSGDQRYFSNFFRNNSGGLPPEVHFGFTYPIQGVNSSSFSASNNTWVVEGASGTKWTLTLRSHDSLNGNGSSAIVAIKKDNVNYGPEEIAYLDGSEYIYGLNLSNTIFHFCGIEDNNSTQYPAANDLIKSYEKFVAYLKVNVSHYCYDPLLDNPYFNLNIEGLGNQKEQEYLNGIREMQDSCNVILQKIDSFYAKLTDGRDFVPEHLRHLQSICDEMKGDVNGVLSQLETSENNVSNLTEEEYNSIESRFNEVSSKILDYDSPMYTYSSYLQAGDFSCNEGGYIKVGDNIIVRNETKKLYSFYSKAFNNNYYDKEDILYISVIPDEGYRISYVKRWWCSTEASYWYSIDFSGDQPSFDSNYVGDGLQVVFERNVNEEWLTELQAIRDEAQTNIERIESLLSLGDWYDDHGKELYNIRYQTQDLLDNISSTEKKVNSGEATLNDINAIRDKWSELSWYYDYIHPMELTITSQGGGYVGVGHNIKVRNTSKYIRYLYPKPWSEFVIEIKPDDEYMVESIVMNGKRTEQTQFSSYNIEGELVVTFRPVDQSQLVLTANSYTREYGDENPNFGYTTSGASLNGTPSITCSATRYSPVGTYPIIITQGSVSNSNVTYVEGTLTITKAPLTITAKSYTRKEGESNPAFDVTYSGFKNGETSSVLTRQPTCSTTATSSSAPGTYDITVSGAEAQNYSISYKSGILTVTEKSQVTFSIGGVSYVGDNTSQSAQVTTVGSNRKSVEIPSTISYNGKNYSVTTISSFALNGLSLDYLSIPSTITSLNSSLFSNCDLGALIWNAYASLNSSVFSNAKFSTASNFLLYVNSSAYAPSNVKNVVVGNVAQTVVLSDNGGNFYCPREFTAQNISYTHNYSMTTGGNGKGWESLALPFDVQKIEHKTKGVLTPFALYSDMMTQRPFWLYELSSNGFRKAEGIKANTPYIIAMPNDSKYDAEYILAGDVTFYATNTRVYQTESLEKPYSNGKTFIPAFAVVNPSSSVYALNVNNYHASYYGSYDAGSWFISNLRKVYPFEAYMTTSSSNARTLSIEFEDDATGIDEVPRRNIKGGVVKVYTLTGLLVFSAPQSEFAERWSDLPSGVYIVNGKKMIKTDDAQSNVVQ